MEADQWSAALCFPVPYCIHMKDQGYHCLWSGSAYPFLSVVYLGFVE